MEEKKQIIWLLWCGLRTKAQTHRLLLVTMDSEEAKERFKDAQTYLKEAGIPYRLWFEKKVDGELTLPAWVDTKGVQLGANLAPFLDLEEKLEAHSPPNQLDYLDRELEKT